MQQDENCVFCKIVAGQIPCFRLFEDDQTLAFMDINPAHDGHCLVITKEHYANIFEIRDELLEEQITTAHESSIPGVLVQDSVTARAQAEVIKAHTLGEHGPLGSIPRDDPRRQQYVSGIALRTALNVAEMGFGVTDLVIGVGAVLAGTGAATVTLATPAMYMLGREAVKR